MSTEALLAFQEIDAYTLADGARRAGTGGVIHSLKPQTHATRFVGRALTARIRHEPNRNVPLHEYGAGPLLDRTGPGDVLVLDAGGLQLSVLGELGIERLVRRGAVAAVINGCIRDAEDIEQTGLPVFALDVVITTVAGHGYVTDIGGSVSVYGTRIATGDVVAGCRGGVVVVPWEQRTETLAEARRIVESDRLVREGIRRGHSVEQLWQAHKRLDDQPG